MIDGSLATGFTNVHVGGVVIEIGVLVVIGSESVAFADNEARNDSVFGVSSVSVSSTGLVVEALVGEDWSLDASDDSLPLVWLANLTGSVSVVDEFTTEESACS